VRSYIQGIIFSRRLVLIPGRRPRGFPREGKRKIFEYGTPSQGHESDLSLENGLQQYAASKKCQIMFP